MNDLRTNRIGRIEPKTGSGTARARGGLLGNAPQETPDSVFEGGQGELEGAFQRLRTLLTFDGNNGPREGVKRRGFYLNILV